MTQGEPRPTSRRLDLHELPGRAVEDADRHRVLGGDDDQALRRTRNGKDVEDAEIAVLRRPRLRQEIWRSPGGRGGVDTIELVLGIAELDGRERWRPTHAVLAAPLATRAGWIVGTGRPVIGTDFGDTWTRVPSSDRWHVWRASIDDHHTARLWDLAVRFSDNSRIRVRTDLLDSAWSRSTSW